MRPVTWPSRSSTLSGNRSAWMVAWSSPPWPASGHGFQAVIDQPLQPRLDVVELSAAARRQRAPAGGAERVRADGGEVGGRGMESAERGTGSVGVARGRPGHRDAADELDQARRTTGQLLQQVPRAVRDRPRHRQAGVGAMRHQGEKIGQVGRLDPLLVERQDEAAAGRIDQVVRVLDALGDALAGHRGTDIVARQERRQAGGVDVGVDRHWLRRRSATAAV